MSNVADHIHQLEALWQSDFPLNRSMKLAVRDYKSGSIRTSAPLAGNTNTHGTAFAGSLYALQALSAWGLVWLELKQAGIDGSIIHASGDIEFHAPITGDIQIQCNWVQAADHLRQLRDHGRVKFTLTTSAGARADASPGAHFSGVYLIRT